MNHTQRLILAGALKHSREGEGFQFANIVQYLQKDGPRNSSGELDDHAILDAIEAVHRSGLIGVGAKVDPGCQMHGWPWLRLTAKGREVAYAQHDARPTATDSEAHPRAKAPRPPRKR